MREAFERSVRLHYLQHEPFEDPAEILTWAQERGFAVSRTFLFRGEELPSPSSFDWLVIMGGSMGVYDERRYPWLVAEKRFIADAISGGKTVLGVCLGAQLISHVLGGAVSKNRYEEIGWFPVKLTGGAATSRIFGEFPQEFMAFHWHADTFAIPEGATRLAESEGCRNQAFQYDNGRVAALQFHIEIDIPSVTKMAQYLARKAIRGKYVQNSQDIIAVPDERFHQIRALLYGMLDSMYRSSS